MVLTIFYNQKYWHRILKFASENLFRNKEYNVKYWYLLFNRNQGDNITFFIKFNNRIKHSEIFFSKGLSEYITTCPSPTKRFKYPLVTFFKDYPNNSIWSNLNKSIVPKNNIGWIARQRISESLIQSLSKGLIDIESIYTFISCMQLGLIKSIYPTLILANPISHRLLRYVDFQLNNSIEYNVDNSKISEQGFIELFEQNSTFFCDLVNSLWRCNNPSLMWLTKWRIYCTQTIKTTNFQKFFFYHSAIIYEISGIKEKNLYYLSSRFLLSMLIERSAIELSKSTRQG